MCHQSRCWSNDTLVVGLRLRYTGAWCPECTHHLAAKGICVPTWEGLQKKINEILTLWSAQCRPYDNNANQMLICCVMTQAMQGIFLHKILNNSKEYSSNYPYISDDAHLYFCATHYKACSTGSSPLCMHCLACKNLSYVFYVVAVTGLYHDAWWPMPSDAFYAHIVSIIYLYLS